MKRTALILTILTTAWAAGAPPQWTPELSMKIQRVSAALPSPDGRAAVWTQTRAVIAKEKSVNLTHVFLAPAGTSRVVQLTRGEKSATNPWFSPDGRYVYFSSRRSGNPGLYRIAVAGGEAVRILEWKGALGAYRLSPDGKWIAFTGRRPDAEREKAKKAKLDFFVVDANPPNHRLWVISSDPETARRNPPRKLFTANYHVGSFRWSPDGRLIAFEHRPSPALDFGSRTDISEVVVESGEVRPVARTAANEHAPRYSPDGRYLAYVETLGNRASDMDGERIVLLGRDGGRRRLPATFEENPSLIGWSPDSRRLFYAEPRHTRAAIYAMPLNGSPEIVYRPASGTLGRGAFLNATGTCLGFAQESPVDPPEAYVLSLAAGAPRRVSRANAGRQLPPLGETRVVKWNSKDGQEIEGLLTLPPGYENGRRVPLVLNIHGGPSGVFTESFIGGPSLYPLAVFAAKGYAVLRVNPRGSAGYGRQFRAAVRGDWGGMDYQDLMTGVDHVIEMGIADPDRLAVMGWSYGGYMTSWVITQTRRFRAAAIGAGITDTVSMWGTNDIPTVLSDYFNGPWWERFDLYVERSPLTHVAAVTTPTLILHGAKDPRVPTTQGYEFYRALKRRGVPVKMVTYPRTEHGPREPKFVLDIMRRHLAWVEEHLR